MFKLILFIAGYFIAGSIIISLLERWERSVMKIDGCDALALEPIGKHEEYLGRRTKRGLFCSSIGKLINADQNGALNIMRKVVGDSYVSRIVNSGHSLCPVRYSNPFVRIV